MALSSLTVWELNASATASNVNGGGFNPANANMLTDLTTDANTANTNSPVVSSASYNFAAGDVNAWLYIKSGTNWTPGWYQITSVASNKATVNAAIGAAIQTNSAIGYPTPKYGTNTVAGCATVGTPTAGTFTIDYSQGTTAKINGITDFASTGASTTLTSATAGFTPVMVGNLFHQTTTGTGAFGIVGWYEIVSYTNATTVVLDRTPNSGTASVATTGYVGGAMSMNSTLDDALFESFTGTNGTGGMRCFVKTGTYNLGQAISIGTGAGGTTAPVVIEGYKTTRGDAPGPADYPIINTGNNSSIMGVYFDLYYIYWTGSASANFAVGVGNKVNNCKFINSGITAGRTAFTPSTATFCQSVEFSSYRGIAIGVPAASMFINGCYIHDSDIGINTSSAGSIVNCLNTLLVGMVTNGAQNITAADTNGLNFTNCSFYGAENKLGVGFNAVITGSSAVRIINSLFYGFVTGISTADAAQTVMFDSHNNFFNNTTDATNWKKGIGTIALNPNFTSVSQATGTAATSSTNVLTASSGTPFSVLTANVDYIQLVSGSGTGFAAGIYLVTAVGGGGANVTLHANITTSGAGSAIVWQSTYGRNFSVGTNMQAGAFPGTFDSIATTSYLDIGGVQRQEQGTTPGTRGSLFIFS